MPNQPAAHPAAIADKERSQLILALNVRRKFCALLVIHGLMLALYSYLFIADPFFGEHANYSVPMVVLIPIGAFVLSLINLLSMFLAACLSPDPRRTADVISFITRIGSPIKKALLATFGLLQAIVFGLILYGIGCGRFSFVPAGWALSALPAFLIALIVGETTEAYYRRHGNSAQFRPQSGDSSGSTPSVGVPAESVQILEQILKAGVPPNKVQQELALLLRRAEPPAKTADDPELLRQHDADLAAIRSSGQDRHLIEAEIAYVRNEFFKRHPHLRKP